MAAAQTALSLYARRGDSHGRRAGAPVEPKARARDAAAAEGVASRRVAGEADRHGVGRVPADEPRARVRVRSGRHVHAIFPDIPNNYRFRTEMDGARSTRRAAWTRSSHPPAPTRGAAEADLRAAEAGRAHSTSPARLLGAGHRARERARVLEQALEREDAWVGDVQARVDAGVLPPNDVLSAQAQRAREAVQLIQATNNAAVADMRTGSAARRRAGRRSSRRRAWTKRSRAPRICGAIDRGRARGDRPREQRAERVEPDGAPVRRCSPAPAPARPAPDRRSARSPASSRRGPTSDSCRDRSVEDVSWDLGIERHVAALRRRQVRAPTRPPPRAGGVRRASHRTNSIPRLALEVRQRCSTSIASRAALAASGEAVAAATEARRVVSERFAAGVATSTDVLDAQLALLRRSWSGRG